MFWDGKEGIWPNLPLIHKPSQCVLVLASFSSKRHVLAWFWWHRSTIPTSHKPCCQLCIIQAALQSSQPSILHQFLCFTSQYVIESALIFYFCLCSSTSLLTLLSFMSFNKKYHIFYIKKLEGKENDNCKQHPSNSSCKR